MYAVLYTHQLEPITVVNIQMSLWNRLANGQIIQLAVMEPFKMTPNTVLPVDAEPCRCVAIFGERIKRREHETLMLFTADEENALILRAEFLPGQRGDVRNRERAAFAAGFVRALQEFGA
jgi:hypothetical protein